MTTLPLLIFDHDGARFAVDARLVRESLRLPELTLVEEAPPWIVGLFNLRGQIIPVADLHLRFGHPAQRYSTTDHVVVLEIDHLATGLIVSEVREVIELPTHAIQTPPQFDAAATGSTHLVVGEVRVGNELVTVLDLARLTGLTEAMALPEDALLTEAAEQVASASYFCPHATAAERAVFRKRAITLQEATSDEEASRLGLAVVELGGEYFGIELTTVLEFCNITELSPIPCCPPHILGAMSLRGELLTLIDPRVALNLPPAARGCKAVIALLGEHAVGIAVDQVHDAVYLRNEELHAPPVALHEMCGTSITGAAPYAGRMMTVLDLPALLAREEWMVHESV